MGGLVYDSLFQDEMNMGCLVSDSLFQV